MSSRDDFVRFLWLAGFELAEDLPTTHVFVHPDGERVLVPKREDWTPSRGQPTNTSPCCSASSRLRLTYDGVMYFRCTACKRFWDQPIAPRPRLVAVK